MLPCTVAQCSECGRTAITRGLCSPHYQRWLRNRPTDEPLRPSRWHPVDKSCLVPGCPDERHAHGYCPRHLERFLKYGDPLKVVRPQGLSVLDRFWSKVQIGDPDECWPWLRGKTSDGYGHFGLSSKHVVRAHRFAWEVTTTEPIPPGLTVDHLCFNTVCCNVAHMELVTNSENLRRAWARRRT